MLGILTAIAVPTFLSVTRSGDDTAAQSNLQTSLTAAVAYFHLNDESFQGIDGGGTASSMSEIGSGVAYVSAGNGQRLPSEQAHVVSVFVAAADVLIMTSLASSDLDCWGILEITAPLSSPVLSENTVGTYFFLSKLTSPRGCVAGTGLATAGIDGGRFPA